MPSSRRIQLLELTTVWTISWIYHLKYNCPKLSLLSALAKHIYELHNFGSNCCWKSDPSFRIPTPIFWLLLTWHPTRRAWVWVNPGGWWWTGRPGVLHGVAKSRTRLSDWTELNWLNMTARLLDFNNKAWDKGNYPVVESKGKYYFIPWESPFIKAQHLLLITLKCKV